MPRWDETEGGEAAAGYIRNLEHENADLLNLVEELRGAFDKAKAENERLRDGLQALHFPSDVPNGVLRSVAYDILMNGMDGDTAAYQIQRRTRLHAEKWEQLERVLQASEALAAHCERGVDVGPVSLAPATEAALWINLRNALDAAARG